MSQSIQEMEALDGMREEFDASDPQAVNNARKKAARNKTDERNTLKTLMEYPNGRQLMFNSVKCILVGNPLVPGDPHSTYFNLGQEMRARDIFKEIVTVCPNEFALMIEENKDDL